MAGLAGLAGLVWPRSRSARFLFARYWENCFTRIYKALYGDAMMVPTNMET